MAVAESDGVFIADSFERRESNPGEEVEEKGIAFHPPLYKQRYDKALDILMEDRWVHAINRVVSSLTMSHMIDLLVKKMDSNIELFCTLHAPPI